MKDEIVTFLRMARTVSSESWRIDLNTDIVGFLHLHFSKCTFGDLILTRKITKNKLDFILSEIDERLVEPSGLREDFIFTVYQAKVIDVYSDTVDHEMDSPTIKDLNEHKKLIRSVLSKYQDARGQLNEHVVKEYFSKLGYVSRKANSDYDANKVDIIAENDTNVIFCQVKLGNISKKTIFEVVDKISNMDKIYTNKNIIICIVAENFPIDIELIKENLKIKFGHKIWTIFKNQIINELPEYKRTLKD